MLIREADPGDLARHKPDQHFELASDGGVSARCSIWWTGMPTWNQHRIGMIGHYSASDSDGVLLVSHACRALRDRGCQLAVGPMDGSTWRSYRFITRFGDEPVFFLEPENPPQWVDHFSQSGFEPLAKYFSAVNEQLERSDPRVARAAQRLCAMGVTVRPLRQETFEEDLRQIYAVSCQVFAGNLLYTDLEETEFMQTYRPLLGRAPLDFVLLAEHGNRTVGFVFALPDFGGPMRSMGRMGQMTARALESNPRTLIIKTLAVLPQQLYAGLGQWLLDEVQRRACAAGFERAIHALVRDSAPLRRISGRFARPMREYTLFARNLTR